MIWDCMTYKPSLESAVSAVLQAPCGPMALDMDGTLIEGDLGDESLRWLLRQGHRPQKGILKGALNPNDALDDLMAGGDVEAHSRACASGLIGVSHREVYEAASEVLKSGTIGLRWPVIELVREAMRVGHTPWILTGSVCDVAWALADQLEISRQRVIGVEMIEQDGRVIGLSDARLTVGEGKVLRWQESVGLPPVLAIGDSESDLPILKQATVAGILLDPVAGLQKKAADLGIHTWVLSGSVNR